MKILINLVVPAISGHYDVLIPDFLKIEDVISLVSEAIEELSDHLYTATGYEVLCLKEKSLILKQEGTLESYGVKNGEQIIML